MNEIVDKKRVENISKLKCFGKRRDNIRDGKVSCLRANFIFFYNAPKDT